MTLRRFEAMLEDSRFSSLLSRKLCQVRFALARFIHYQPAIKNYFQRITRCEDFFVSGITHARPCSPLRKMDTPVWP